MEDNNFKEIQDLRAISQTHVTYTIFTWVVGILVVIAISCFTYQSQKIAKIEEEQVVSKVEFAKIQQQLAQLQVSMDEQKTLLIQHEKDSNR